MVIMVKLAALKAGLAYRKKRAMRARQRRRVGGVRSALKSSFGRKVLKVINATREQKCQLALVENTVQHNSAIGGADISPLMPPISQGTQGNQRVGNEIKIMNMRVALTISLSPGQESNIRNLRVRYLIAENHSYKTNTVLAANSALVAGNILMAGSLGTSFDGTTNRLLLPWNRDDNKIYAAGDFNLTDGTVEQNNQVSYTKVINLKVPRKIMYDEASAEPNNFAPYFAVGYGYPDGSPPDIVATKIVATVVSSVYYTDA